MTTLPDVTAGAEDGFVDVNFRAHDVDGSNDAITMSATGLFRGAEVGFTIHIGDSWNEQVIDEELTVLWGKIRLSSRGDMSDRMVRALDELYETAIGADAMTDTGELTAVALSGSPPLVRESPVKMKVFFHDDGPVDRYGEVFLNIDLSAARIELHEKDPDYRRPVVLALSQVAG